jgi:CubicO group peptidase (beta-lactamase class C family)
LFPELAPLTHPAYVNTTVAALMSHSSLMPYQPGMEGGDEFGNMTKDLRQRRYLYVKAAVQDPPVTPSPYGGGSIVVAAMLEKIMGKTWESLMQTYVFDDAFYYRRVFWPSHLSPLYPPAAPAQMAGAVCLLVAGGVLLLARRHLPAPARLRWSFRWELALVWPAAACMAWLLQRAPKALAIVVPSLAIPARERPPPAPTPP